MRIFFLYLGIVKSWRIIQERSYCVRGVALLYVT
jgi:hypothetical protein